jgi:hypothetical protein
MNDEELVRRRAEFGLEIKMMREDYADPGVSTHTIDRHIRNLAKRFPAFPTWTIRGLVEEVWRADVGNGTLKCNVCRRPCSQHPIGHCPDLRGEPVYQDAVSKRTLQRRKLKTDAAR